VFLDRILFGIAIKLPRSLGTVARMIFILGQGDERRAPQKEVATPRTGGRPLDGRPEIQISDPRN